MARPRDSVFSSAAYSSRPDPVSPCPPSLTESVAILNDICLESYDAQTLFRNGTYDLPRMAHILHSQRVFLFVNESTIAKYKSDLAEEVEPQIWDLIQQARTGMEALERKQKALRAKNDQMAYAKSVGTTTDRLFARRLQTLRTQRERLEDELRTLKAEVESLEAENFLE